MVKELSSVLDKQYKKSLKALYERLDAIAESHNEVVSDDVRVLRKLHEKHDLLKSLRPNTVEYSKAFRSVLLYAYKYYLLTGEVLDQYTPDNVDANYLVEWYNREHQVAFNLGIQRRVHYFLLQIAPVLTSLMNAPKIESVDSQFYIVRDGFGEQIQFLLMHGFSLDLEYYEKYIDPYWQILKASRVFTASSFKPLVSSLEKYTRLRTGNELEVIYTPDEGHTKTVQQNDISEADRKRQEYERKKAETRLGVKEVDDKLIVTLPEKRSKG